MEFITQHPWRELILAPLSAEQSKSAIALDNSDWEYIDMQMAKLGTISHESVDINDVQQKILSLLSGETKDFRLVAHLLNTLQRSEQAAHIVLAIALLSDYVEHFWSVASPQKNMSRIAQMVIQRFNNAKEQFSRSAISEERETSLSEFIRLKQLLSDYTPLVEAIDRLIVSYSSSAIAETPPSSSQNNSQPKLDKANPAPAPMVKAPLPSVALDDSSERAWSKTLLKIAEIETERDLTAPISFQLRRHAVWFNVTAAPPDNNCVTTVPPLPQEKLNEFNRELNQPSQSLWLRVENTIAYSPYWLDGHCLSASIAAKLGYPAVAEVIKCELKHFLTRFPECQRLCFSNQSPFISEPTLKWLKQNEGQSHARQEYTEVLALFDSEGLQPALALLEQTTGNELRQECHSQLQIATLLSQAGCHKLARQQLDSLIAKTEPLPATAWEPSFFENCRILQDQFGKKEQI